MQLDIAADVSVLLFTNADTLLCVCVRPCVCDGAIAAFTVHLVLCLSSSASPSSPSVAVAAGSCGSLKRRPEPRSSADFSCERWPFRSKLLAGGPEPPGWVPHKSPALPPAHSLLGFSARSHCSKYS